MTGLRAANIVAEIVSVGAPSALIVWGITGIVRRRIHVRTGRLVGREAVYAGTLFVALGAMGLGILLSSLRR